MGRRLAVVGIALTLTGCASWLASLPVGWSVIATDATACAIALASDASVFAQEPDVQRLSVSPSIAGVLALLSTLDHLLPASIQACTPFIRDVEAEFSGEVVTPARPSPSRPGRPNEAVPNPWKGLLHAGDPR